MGKGLILLLVAVGAAVVMTVRAAEKCANIVSDAIGSAIDAW